MRGRHLSQKQLHRRHDVVFGVGVLVGVVGFALVVLWLQGLTDDLRTANTARDALASQVEQLGASPVAGSPGSRGEPGKSIVGPSGPPGEPGSPGPSGAPGSPGRDGKEGATGATGSPGGTGATGPAGAAGSPGPAGVQGDAGPAGPQGPAGKDGKDGQPPAGWTFTYDGVTYTCSPADGFDESDPRYACTSDEPSSSPLLPVDPGASLLVGCAALRRRDGRGRGVRGSGRHRAVGRRGGAHR